MGDLWSSIALADELAGMSAETLFLISGGEEAKQLLRGREHTFKVVASPSHEWALLRDLHPDAIVVNKLKNPSSYIKGLKELTSLVVTIDDSGEGSEYADLKVNVLYPVADSVADPRFIALRTEFRESHSLLRPVRDTVQELLIAQGGSDTYGFTPRILRSIHELRCRPHCTVVLGPAFRHEAELQKALEGSSLDLTVVRNASNMSELMCSADLAISAGGITMFELACVGTPVVVVCAEPFEADTAARLEQAEVVVNLGFGGSLDYSCLPLMVDALSENPGRRERMAAAGKLLVDGRGAQRVAQLIQERLRAGTAVRP